MEAQFTARRYFALDGTNYDSHAVASLFDGATALADGRSVLPLGAWATAVAAGGQGSTDSTSVDDWLAVLRRASTTFR